MQFTQRMLLLAALYLASASWFHAQSPGEEETEQKHASIGRGPEGTWVAMLDLNGTRLRFVLTMRNASGGVKLLLGSSVN
jgi:hypothetical protein